MRALLLLFISALFFHLPLSGKADEASYKDVKTLVTDSLESKKHKPLIAPSSKIYFFVYFKLPEKAAANGKDRVTFYIYHNESSQLLFQKTIVDERDAGKLQRTGLMLPAGKMPEGFNGVLRVSLESDDLGSMNSASRFEVNEKDSLRISGIPVMLKSGSSANMDVKTPNGSSVKITAFNSSSNMDIAAVKDETAHATAEPYVYTKKQAFISISARDKKGRIYKGKKEFYIVPAKQHNIAIKGSSTLKIGEGKTLKMTLPKEFKAPYTVDYRHTGNIKVLFDETRMTLLPTGLLKGPAVIAVRLTDDQGRIGTAYVKLTVLNEIVDGKLPQELPPSLLEEIARATYIGAKDLSETLFTPRNIFESWNDIPWGGGEYYKFK